MDAATVMIRTYLDFEKPIAELESKIEELKALKNEDSTVSIDEELKLLDRKARSALKETYAQLTPWQKTQVARHPDRPHCVDYLDYLIEDFVPLCVRLLSSRSVPWFNPARNGKSSKKICSIPTLIL